MTELSDLAALKDVLGGTADGPAFIFKHSTVCPISANAHGRVKEYLQQAPDSAPEFFLIKVIESRPVSNAVAEDLGVEHESPQLLLVNGGEALWSTSHSDITAEAIEGAIAKYLA